VKRIRYLYRLQYVRNTLLQVLYESPLAKLLDSNILGQQCQIITALQKDSYAYIKAVLARLRGTVGALQVTCYAHCTGLC
jgi:Component of IIS longevity pathway SMK-1